MQTDDNISFIQGEPVEKDWDWWSNFLQREYYGTPDELDGWTVTASSIAHELGYPPGARLLDLGSGCGEIVMQLALRGYDATGIEQSASLVEYCQGRARMRGVAATFMAADMFTFEPEGTFDAIVSINTSFGYGTEEQNRALIAKIGRWLKPGGKFYCDLISSDCAESFGCWSDEVAGGRFIVDNSYDTEERIMTSYPTWVSPDESTIYTATSPEIVRLYERADMESMMRAAGLTPRRLDRAMGRKFIQDPGQMLTTWVAEKGGYEG
jgi:SAM-dependent methyltransferase